MNQIAIQVIDDDPGKTLDAVKIALEVLWREPTEEALEHLREKLRIYPPPPPASTYQRTMRLKNSWRSVVVMVGGVLGRVTSQGVPYNIYVQDRRSQATIHQGRWQTVQDVEESEAGEVAEIFDRWIERVIGKA